MVELEEPKSGTAAAGANATLQRNNATNNNPRGSGDSGIRSGSGISCSNTDNSCSQSQSGEH